MLKVEYRAYRLQRTVFSQHIMNTCKMPSLVLNTGARKRRTNLPQETRSSRQSGTCKLNDDVTGARREAQIMCGQTNEESSLAVA